MKSKWEFSLYKVVLLFYIGMIIGGAIALLTTNNMNILGGILVIVSMILVSVSILMGCRKKEAAQ
jgi:hypothetical protein